MRAALTWVFALLAFSVGVAAQAAPPDPATRDEVLVAAVDIMREARGTGLRPGREGSSLKEEWAPTTKMEIAVPTTF